MGGEKIAMVELTLGYFKMHISHLNNNNKIGRVSVSSTIHRIHKIYTKNARPRHAKRDVVFAKQTALSL